MYWFFNNWQSLFYNLIHNTMIILGYTCSIDWDESTQRISTPNLHLAKRFNAGGGSQDTSESFPLFYNSFL